MTPGPGSSSSRAATQEQPSRTIWDDDKDLTISAVNLAEVYRWILRYYDEKTAEDKKEAMKERCSLINVDIVPKRDCEEEADKLKKKPKRSWEGN